MLQISVFNTSSPLSIILKRFIFGDVFPDFVHFLLPFIQQRVISGDVFPDLVHVRGNSEEPGDVPGSSLQLGNDRLGTVVGLPHAQTHHSRLQDQQKVPKFVRSSHRANQLILTGQRWARGSPYLRARMLLESL